MRNFLKITFYFEVPTHDYEILGHYFEKVSPHNDLKGYFFHHIGGIGLP